MQTQTQTQTQIYATVHKHKVNFGNAPVSYSQHDIPAAVVAAIVIERPLLLLVIVVRPCPLVASSTVLIIKVDFITAALLPWQRRTHRPTLATALTPW
jgi:hypothetical protein